MPKVHDVCVIGCGPAGIAAAVQLRRAGIDPLVFEEGRIGGLLNNAFLVENYPGFSDGISGVRLVKKFQEHLAKWNIPVIMKKVDHISREGGVYTLDAGRTYRSRFVVYAAGTRPRTLGVHSDTAERYIVYEVISLRRVRHKHIVIIGAGDAGFDYALGLGQHNRVTVLNKNPREKGLVLLSARLKKGIYKKNVRYVANTRVVSIKRGMENKQYNLVIRARTGAACRDIPCHYVLAAIGRKPELQSLSSRLRRMHPKSGGGFFFAGDVKNGDARQTAIAVGDGIKAAMHICAALHKK